MITGTPKDAPHNYLLASKQGAAFDIEALYEDSDILTPRGRFLVHTNHLLSPRLMIRDELKAEIPDTVIRLWRAQRLLADQRGVFGVSEMKTLLSDHFDAPDSICRHGVTDEGGFETITKCSVIMELADGRLHVSEGYPCDTPFETFEFV